MGHPGFVKPVDRLGQGIVGRASNTADRRHKAGFAIPRYDRAAPSLLCNRSAGEYEGCYATSYRLIGGITLINAHIKRLDPEKAE